MKKLENNSLLETQGGNCFLAGAGLILSSAGGAGLVFAYSFIIGPYLGKCWNT